MPHVSATPKCPHCGFTVFANRYPKCEKCGHPLPVGLVLSKQDRDAVMEKERLEALELEQAKRRNAKCRSGGVDSGFYPGIGVDFGGGGSDTDGGGADGG